MPIYEYECRQCHEVSDTLQKVGDPTPATCPRCGAQGTLARLVSRTSFVLKGGGWSSDLYASSSAKKPEPKGEGAESKPAAAKTDSGSASTDSSGSTSTGGASSPTPKVAAAGEKS
jgi:putative FmdB family regulatory protein